MAFLELSSCALLAVLLLSPITGQSSNDPARLDGRARNLSQVLRDSSNARLDVTRLRQTYLNRTEGVNISRVNGTEAVEDIAAQLSLHFQQVKDALKNNTAAAKQAYLLNENTDCCSPECTDVRGKNFNLSACCNVCREICRVQNDSSEIVFKEPQLNFYRARVEDQAVTSVGGPFADIILRQSRKYGGRMVNESYTALHYPLDIFNRDPRVLCFAQWSSNLTQQYIQEGQELNIASQYFASNTGILRTFPASDWQLLNRCHRCPRKQVDTYDSRNRPWYVNTIPGTKFLVIIMDTSGSMNGYRLLLAKIVAQNLLLSLSQNDFFLVLKVGGSSDEPRPLGGCFSNKTRATPQNILTMNELIEQLDDVQGKVENYNSVLTLAVEELSSEPECHGIIALLSDSDSVTARLANSIETTNAGNISRVFVFLTGFRRSLPFDTGDSARNQLKITACSTGGELFDVQDYSDILERLKDFTTTLRYAAPIAESMEAVFWNFYRDVFGGLSLTGSQPLFSDEESRCNSSFVGVSGIDVGLENLRERFFQRSFGVFGYNFLMDNNGQLLIHPLINYTYISKLSGDDLIAQDVSDFEHPLESADFEEIRRSMVDGKMGSRTIAAWVPVGGEEQFKLMNVTYYYAPVEGTPFRVGVVIPTMASERSLDENFNVTMNHFNNDTTTYYLDPERSVCGVSAGLLPMSMPEEFLKGLIKLRSQNQSMASSSCAQQRYEQLLFDVSLSYDLISALPQPSPGTKPPQIRMFFLQFVSGLTACYLPQGIDSSKVDDVVCPERFGSYIQDTVSQLGNDSGKLLYHTTDDELLLEFRVLEENGNREELESAFALVGFVSQQPSLQKQLFGIAVSVEEGVDPLVYVLEGTGKIASGNGPVPVGTPFLELYPEIFEELVNQGVYAKMELRGQEVRPCADLFRFTTGCRNSSSFSIHRGILLSLMSGLQWILSGGLWTTMQLAFISLHASVQNLLVSGKGEEDGFTSCQVRLCQRQTIFYQLTNQDVSMNWTEVACRGSGGNSNFRASSVPGTNLLLVEVLGNCSQPITPEEEGMEGFVPVPCPCDCASMVANCTERDVYRRGLQPDEGGVCFSQTNTTTISTSCCKSSRGFSLHHGLLFTIFISLRLYYIIT